MNRLLLPLALIIGLCCVGCARHKSADAVKSPATPKPSRDPSHDWIHGYMTRGHDGAIFHFRIEPKRIRDNHANGGLVAKAPDTGEQFTGSYSGIINESHARVFTPRGPARLLTRDATANAVGVLRGDQGTVVQLQLQIATGRQPHGIGTGTDNRGATYQVQF